jgi:hypothetical protein
MIQITTTNQIMLNGQITGLNVAQLQDRTMVYRNDCSEIVMPKTRYSTSHNAPASGAAGRDQLEAHIREVLA